MSAQQENTGRCHCGEPAVASCPCCQDGVCIEHLTLATQALARAIGLPGAPKEAGK